MQLTWNLFLAVMRREGSFGWFDTNTQKCWGFSNYATEPFSEDGSKFDVWNLMSELRDLLKIAKFANNFIQSLCFNSEIMTQTVARQQKPHSSSDQAHNINVRCWERFSGKPYSQVTSQLRLQCKLCRKMKLLNILNHQNLLPASSSNRFTLKRT